MMTLALPIILGLIIVAQGAVLFLLGLKIGALSMADLSKLSASIDRAVAQYQAAQASLAASDQQGEVDALTSKLDAAFPAPPAEPETPVEPAPADQQS